MRDTADRKYSLESSKISGQATASGAERRGDARHIFTATAEVVELGTGARFSTRTTDLGPGGCFVDTLVPFPVGSNVRIALHKGKNTFETEGKVVYAQAGLGMGIAFNELSPEQANSLRDWLTDVTHNREVAYEILRTVNPGVTNLAAKTLDKAMMTRMVHLLIGKGILTEAEGSAILYEPVL
ncbi:MAG: PilZ domain-containing protein [Candidatus Acidiferrales bacterium]